MTESHTTQVAADTVDNSRKAGFLERKLPFVALLVLAIVGVAYTNISQQPLAGYWEFLALASGIVCVVTQWSSARDKQARLRLIITQGLHWVAILVTMEHRASVWSSGHATCALSHPLIF
jgi:hypothetical protein